MTFDHPVGASGGDISYIGLPDPFACGRIHFPTFLELSFVLAYPVLVVGNVGGDAVVEVLAYLVLPAELDFDATVGDLCDVLFRSTGVTHHHIHRRGVENAVGEFVVEVDGSGEAVLEETEVNAYVGHGSGLPGEGVVLDGGDGNAVGDFVGAEHVVGAAVGGLPVVVANGVVAQLAPGETQLEVVNLSACLEPWLLADSPSGGEGREEAPSVLRRKAR